MSKWINKVAIASLILFGLSGCIEERVIVKIKKDGSGVVEHFSYNNVEDAMDGFLSGLVEQQAGKDAGEAVDKRLTSEFNEEYFKKFAAGMGEGVSVKDYEVGSNTAGMKGYRALYEFKDINKIAVKMRENIGGDGKGEELSEQKDALTQQPDFSMKDGVLRIKIPHQYEAETGNPDDIDNMPPQMLGMMAAMLQGTRIAISVEGLDDIKKTNAHHRDGNTVVLTNIQLDKLLGNEASLKQVSRIGSLPRNEMQALADQTEGMDIDLQEEIVIHF